MINISFSYTFRFRLQNYDFFLIFASLCPIFRKKNADFVRNLHFLRVKFGREDGDDVFVDFVFVIAIELVSWTEKLVSIEVNHMVRHICNPNFRFPCKALRKLLKSGKVQEGCRKNLTGLNIFSHL